MGSDSDNIRGRIEHARGEPPIRGRGLLRRLDGVMIRLDRAVEAIIPARYNPFAQTGAIATAAFLVSAISGILLLIWYRPSVHQAYESVMAMESIWIGAFMRSLHRYSSDVCILFAMIHGLRLFFAGRFTGARWLAWVTGIALIGLLWFVGWTGYLLVWDEPAQLIALGSAQILDLVPIFAEPVSRAFLADELVPSLIFFVVFFTHMLVPLALAAGVWLHVARVQRPQVLTSRWMSIWTVGALVVLSVAFPASAGPAADLGATPEAMNIDVWYLAPLWLTDRLSAGLLWSLLAIGVGLVIAIPWLLSREPPKTAEVRTSACNGCTLCARDCPYDAIIMVPREDNRRYELVAKLDPKRCVGCGICAGSCNPGGIGLDWLPVQAMRRRFDDWIDKFVEESPDDEGPLIAFLCADSAGADWTVDPETGRCEELPGYRVVAVPCTGWVQPLTVERALRRGAAGILVVGCSGAEPQYREGNRWTERRLAATREPGFRREKVESWRVRHVTYDRTRPEQLLEYCRIFSNKIRKEDDNFEETTRNSVEARHIVGGLFVAAGLSAIVAVGSVIPYPGPPKIDPMLVVSINHHGQLEERCEPIPEEERAAQPAHMQQEEVCERRRAEVIVEIDIDGEIVDRQSHPARGISRDGPAVSLDEIEVDAGRRHVTVRIADGADQEWSFEQSWEFGFEEGTRQVLLFDTREGFRHFGGD